VKARGRNGQVKRMSNAVSCNGKEHELLIQMGECSVAILPRLGGKISSIRVKDQELLQTPLIYYAPRSKTMPFESSDASGWDECLPAVTACKVQTAHGAVEVPDHGDLWRVPWQTLAKTENSLTMRGECFTLPLVLKRRLAVTETGHGYLIQSDYTLTNTGSFEVPWLWSAHPGFLAQVGDTLQLPQSIQSLRIEWTRHHRLDTSSGEAAWPLAALSDGAKTDLRVTPKQNSGVGDKLFAGPLSASENWAVLERPSVGVRLRISFDAARTPYLGLWICQDGFPECEGERQHCVALEPTTAPVDSLSIPGPWSRTLAPGESIDWPMTVAIERL